MLSTLHKKSKKEKVDDNDKQLDEFTGKTAVRARRTIFTKKSIIWEKFKYNVFLLIK